MRPLYRIAALFAFLPAGALAHDLWLEKKENTYTLWQGHRHSAHAGAETVPYGEDFVLAASCRDAEGRAVPLRVLRRTPWQARGECISLKVETSSGYWSKTPWETRNAPKTETPGAIKSWRTLESIVWLERFVPRLTIPLGQGLELVPSSDPFAVKPGEKLRLRVFKDGQPLSGVAVAYRGKPRGTTDASGEIAIRLREPGLQLIAASSETPLADGKADLLVETAILQFELRP